MNIKDLNPEDYEVLDDAQELESPSLNINSLNPEDYEVLDDVVEESVVESPKPIEEQKTDALSSILGAGSGFAAGKSSEGLITKAGRGLESLAESGAFKAIGGETSAKGRKLLKEDLSRLGLSETEFSPKKIGRKVLEEGLTPIPVIRQSGKVLEGVEKKLKSSVKKTNELLQKVNTPKQLEEVYSNYKKLVSKNLDPTISEDKSILKKIAAEEVDFKGIRTAEELERGKRKLQQRIDYADPEKTVKSKMRASQAKVYKDSVEDLVQKEGGEELLDRFRKLKLESGQQGLIKDILTEGEMPKGKFMKALSGPMDFLKEGAESLTGIGAVASDIAGKTVKKLAKGLPVIGAGIGGLLGYQSARAEGAKPSEALGQAAEEELLGVLAPESAGPKRGTLAHKLESGEQLTPVEHKQLNKPSNQTIEKRTESNLDSLDSVVKSSPEQIQKFSEVVSQDDAFKSYVGPLQQAAKAPERTRKAILFGLYQQPAFREMIKRIEEGSNE